MPITTPKLPASCGSWVVVEKGTINAVVEIFDAGIVAMVDAERFDVLTTLDYLQRFNASVKAA